MPTICRVALPVPLPQLFDYLPVTGIDAAVGARVRVPFGRGHRIGVVVEKAERAEVADAQLRRIEQVLDSEALFDEELRATLAWAGHYWLGAPGEVYANALPGGLRDIGTPADRNDQAWTLTDAGRSALTDGSRRGRSLALLQALAEGPASADALHQRLPGWRDAARRLRNAGLVVAQPLATASSAEPQPGPPLHPDQQTAVDAVDACFGDFAPFLLDGVTGSGKTEVYLALIERALAADRQVLMLVPEIGLAPQTLRRLRQRLGIDIDVLHSNLADGARRRAWLRARNGEARVILGTRSAVFTPLPKAGLIIVDEEHDASYKQQEGFRYHARDLAVYRARAVGVPVVLGSATPSLESLANVEAGRYRRLHLASRAGRHAAPQVQIIDIRSQRLRHGLSPALLQALGECVERGEQALVFRNRRGYAPVLLCHACGWHAACDRCDKPMTLHARRARLICHHCERERRTPAACPSCGSLEIKPQGYGTERLEEALRERFTQVPVLRIDRETTRRRDAFEELLGQLDSEHAAILVGTQMLAKGHDLPNLTLVAIVGVDEGLHSVDFRAAERLAQLVVQVAGRAGRAGKPGRVLLQTHHPGHPLLHLLLQRGYAAVATELLAERRLLGLPPYGHQALLRAEAHRPDHLEAFLEAALATQPDADDGVAVAGPMPAPMPLRAGRHRGQLLLEAETRAALQRRLRGWPAQLAALPGARKLRWSLDVDPIDLY